MADELQPAGNFKGLLVPFASLDELLCSSQRPMQVRQSATGPASGRSNARPIDERWPLYSAAHLLAQTCQIFMPLSTLNALDVSSSKHSAWEQSSPPCAGPGAAGDRQGPQPSRGTCAYRVTTFAHVVQMLCRRPSSSPHAADDAVLLGHPSGEGDAHGAPVLSMHSMPATICASRMHIKAEVEHDSRPHV